MTDQTAAIDQGPTAGLWPRPSWWWVGPAAALLILLYYPVGMILAHHIDDDPAFGLAEGSVAASQSRAVAIAAAVVRREVDETKWTPNDPFFQPSWALDDMPAYQQGIVAAVGRFASALNDVSSDSDLEHAAGLFKYPGTIWMFDTSTSWAPTASAEKQYRLAARYLEAYDQRLAGGDAVFDRGPKALVAVLGRISADLAATAETLAARVDDPGVLDTQADDVFYAAKGQLYADSLLLRELGWDYSATLGGRELGDAWRRMADSAAAAARLDPLVALNAQPDSAVLPNHLAAQGFQVMRLRAQLAEIAARLAD